MKKHFLPIILLILSAVSEKTFCQDIIKTKSGEEIKAKVLKISKKEASYKTYNDPEFSTYTLPYKELSSISKEGEKKPILFNHNLPRGYVCVSGGISLPLGNLKKTAYDDSGNEPGFAKKGMNAKVDIGFYVYKKIGISACVGFFENTFDFEKYGTTFDGQLGASSSSNSTGTSRVYTNPTDGSNWQFIHFQLGPLYSIKFNNRFTWDLKARGGFTHVSKPTISLNVSNTFDPNFTTYSQIEYSYDPKMTPSLNVGTSVRYLLTKRLALCLSADYIKSSPELNVLIVDNSATSSTGSGNGIKNSSVPYKLSSLNIGAGLAYSFKRKGNKYE